MQDTHDLSLQGKGEEFLHQGRQIVFLLGGGDQVHQDFPGGVASSQQQVAQINRCAAFFL